MAKSRHRQNKNTFRMPFEEIVRRGQFKKTEFWGWKRNHRGRRKGNAVDLAGIQLRHKETLVETKYEARRPSTQRHLRRRSRKDDAFHVDRE